MHTKMGRFEATVKSVDDEGTFEAIMSVPTLDRDGEVVDVDAFKPLPAHITIDIDHAMSVEKTVGSGTPFYDGDVLKIRGRFASTELGQTVRTLVKEGHINRMSVAYMNAQYESGDDNIPHLRKGELLNAAIVGIPSNREAAILSAKQADIAAVLDRTDPESPASADAETPTDDFPVEPPPPPVEAAAAVLPASTRVAIAEAEAAAVLID